jgi:glyoxylase-like metal-dependent hydrolase (beta-lactamase superfamily II)/8-oxo-dGTP pyrophosphatase MutT (NUDIX family)
MPYCADLVHDRLAMTESLIPRSAATLALLRDGARGPEVLLMRRTHLAEFASGAYVFPGGSVDAADRDPALAMLAQGLDDEQASRALGMREGGLAYWIAAIRECCEEAGLLLAYDGGGDIVGIEGEAHRAEFTSRRRALAQGHLALADLLREGGLTLATDKLAYLNRWITQPGRPRRFDTRFFLARAPLRQQSEHDGSELLHHVWLTPEEALARHSRGEVHLLYPTTKTLQTLARFKTVDEALAYARADRPMPAMTARPATSRAGPVTLFWGDYAYAEVGKLDPGQTGVASCEIVPGKAVTLSPRVRRITAPNPGMMTGPGTNTYLLGDASTGVAVIDPGPAIDSHIDAIVAAAAGPIRWILCTHTHIDHSPAALALKACSGAMTFGMLARHLERQDTTFQPDTRLTHGERIAAAGCTLRVLHTPGHASNQLCYLLEEEKLLFTGDHIMQGSTVVINPPDGDMGAYFDSLGALLAEDVAYVAPGHGFLMDRLPEVVDRLIIHRRERENKILHALRALGPAAVEDLVPTVYNDTPPARHAVAARSLLAHLIKLEAEGRARKVADERWAEAGT